MAEHFLNERFDAALALSSVSKKDLAAALGVSPGRVSQFKDKPPTPEMRDRMAELLRVTPDFFSRRLPNVDPPYWRRLTKTPMAVQHRYIALAGLAGEAIDIGGLKQQRNLPDLSDLHPAAAAAELRAEMGYQPDEPLVGLVTLLEQQGTWVHELDLADDSLVDAFCTYVDGVPLIFLNPVKADPYRARHNGSHELGHLTRDEVPATDGTGRKVQEDAANEFAGELLLPVRVWRDLAPRRGLNNPWTYLGHKRRFGVSVKSLMRKTHEAGLLNDAEYRYGLMRYSSMGWNSGEPEPDGEDETDVRSKPTLGDQLLRAYGSVRALADALDVSLDLAGEVLGKPTERYSNSPRLRVLTNDEDPVRTPPAGPASIGLVRNTGR